MVSNMTRKIVAALFLVLCLAGCADTVIFLPDDPVKTMAVPVGETEIPAGEPEDPEPGDPLTIRLAGNILTEEYNGCCWTSVQRIMTREGLRKIRKGFALERKVESDG